MNVPLWGSALLRPGTAGPSVALPETILTVGQFLQRPPLDQVIEHHSAHRRPHTKETGSLSEMQREPRHLTIQTENRRDELAPWRLAVGGASRQAAPIFALKCPASHAVPPAQTDVTVVCAVEEASNIQAPVAGGFLARGQPEAVWLR